jgi:hypothetical protein
MSTDVGASSRTTALWPYIAWKDSPKRTSPDRSPAPSMCGRRRHSRIEKPVEIHFHFFQLKNSVSDAASADQSPRRLPD